MDKIVAYIQPFDAKQNIAVYVNNALKETVLVDFSQVSTTVKSLMSLYGIRNVTLVGSNDYLTKFRAEIGGVDYATGIVNIDIINR